MRKKILFVDNRSQYFVSHRLTLAAAVRDRLGEVHVTTLSRRDQDIEKIAASGMAFHRLSRNSNNRSVVKPLSLALELGRLFDELRPNLIHIFTLKAMCVSGFSLLRSQPKAVLMTVTGLGYAFTSRSLKARFLGASVAAIIPPLLKRAGDEFIFQNQDDLAVFHRRFGIQSERLSLIRGSGVDLGTYQTAEERTGTLTVALVARMLLDKGVVEFVEAAKRLKREGLEARFILAGDPDPENPAGIAPAQLQQWHESGVVEWRGYCHDMPGLFAETHIVCLPSYREGAPRVLIEAASCGKPIVATDVSGCREVVRHGENGLLVPARDSVALANALRALIQNRELRICMGRNGRAFAERELSLEKVIGENFKLYEKHLSHGHEHHSSHRQ
jgi:glycosyltransferase involved in cell wall biosynthesis